MILELFILYNVQSKIDSLKTNNEIYFIIYMTLFLLPIYTRPKFIKFIQLASIYYADIFACLTFDTHCSDPTQPLLIQLYKYNTYDTLRISYNINSTSSV